MMKDEEILGHLSVKDTISTKKYRADGLKAYCLHHMLDEIKENLFREVHRGRDIEIHEAIEMASAKILGSMSRSYKYRGARFGLIFNDVVDFLRDNAMDLYYNLISEIRHGMS
jgi:hypothetical protein